MTLDKRIKVIKRDERSRPDTLTAARSEEAEHAEQLRPDVAKNNATTIVTSWVRELHRRKDVDARRAFESLFHKAA
jgi:hypothetical protein